MRRMSKLGALVATIAIAGLGGCADLEDAGPEVEDRTWWLNFWEWQTWKPANGDLEIHEGETTEVEECLIFDLTGSGVSQRAVDTSSPNGVRFEPVLEVVDNELRTPQGDLVCYAYETDHPLVYQLADAEGEVLFTLFNDWVFDGDLQVPPPGGKALVNALQNDLAYTIKQDHVYIGPHGDGHILATATEQVTKANPMRKLLIAALVDGQCGAVGIVPHPDAWE